MKKIIFFLFLFATNMIFAQSKVIENISGYELLNSGSLSDNNNEVDGYYFFYKVDDLEDRKSEYAIVILDKNLNETARKSYVGNKYSRLIQGVFDGNQITFLFFNEQRKFIKLIGYDRKGQEVEPLEYKLTRQDVIYTKNQYDRNNEIRLIPIDKKGILLKFFKNQGEQVQYIPTGNGEVWGMKNEKDTIEYVRNKVVDIKFGFFGIGNSKVGSRELKEYKILGIGKSFAAITEFNIDASIHIDAYNHNTNYRKQTKSSFFKIIKVDTGELIYSEEIPYKIKKKEQFKSYLNVIFTDEEIVALGEYYVGPKNLRKGISSGLFIEKFRYDGKKLSGKQISWENQLFQKFQQENKEKGKNYVFFHNVVKTDDGFVAIGEQYKKAVSAGGVTAKIITLGLAQASKIMIKDAYFFQFDNDFNLVDLTKIEKAKSLYGGLSDFSTPQESAHYLNTFGYFDYLQTQVDKKHNKFYTTFLDYDNSDKKDPKLTYKTVVFQDSKFKETSFSIPKNEKVKYTALPAKLGYVLIYEYDEEKEKSSLRLEKIDVE